MPEKMARSDCWRGMSRQEIDATGGTGLFCQRVFAHGFDVGVKGSFDYWADHWKGLDKDRGSEEFWSPKSLKVRYSIARGQKSQDGVVGKIMTVFAAPVMIVATTLAGVRINAVPDKDWKIPLDAPKLPSFKPAAMRFGKPGKTFDQGYETPGQSRDPNRVRPADDSYAGDRAIPRRDDDEDGAATDAALGNRDSEAAMRYEDHARLRMRAKREGRVKKTDKVTEEDHPEQASAEYKTWHDRQIKDILTENIDAHATDHSTIMTNPDHAKNALAYDIAIGMCHIRTSDLHELRIAADWRFVRGSQQDDADSESAEYFIKGKLNEKDLSEWIKVSGSEGHMPEKIVDQREHSAWRSPHGLGGHP